MKTSAKLVVLIAAMIPVVVLAGKAPAVVYRKAYAAKVPMHIVQIDPTRRDVNLAIASPSAGFGARESWSSLVKRARPVAAITGTYFDTHSGLPIGTLGVAGTTIYSGFIGTAFTYSPTVGGAINWAKPRTSFDFTGADTYLRAGPRLLEGGRTALWPRDEGFRDPAIFQKKRRSAIAITKAGKILLVSVEKAVLLRELAAALKGLGAVDAMCLDGGSSTGLYYRGKSHVVPSRPLTNLLVVYESKQAYTRYVASR